MRSFTIIDAAAMFVLKHIPSFSCIVDLLSDVVYFSMMAARLVETAVETTETTFYL